ncbi:MAG: XRE family transcriptional regulator [Fusobacteriia bacterium 4572_132]|nr:MAG: XRE family transcriptional regulator [Fusobacteriia bacterium 4572_132]
MKKEKVGRLPVIKNNQIIGVIDRDDILVREEKAPIPPVIAFWDVLFSLPHNKGFEKKLKKMSAFKAEDIMSKKYLTTSPEEILEELVTKMIEKKYSFALVFEKDVLCGIVTKTDLIEKSFE